MTGKEQENAVIYARYSSHNQQEQSIEGQLAAAYNYAEKKGYTIVKEYCDRAKTGTNDNREEFQRMLSDCAKKQFSVIIVWKVDRFGRNREEITFNKYRAKKHGVRVEYVAETISEGPEGVILESVLEGMAEYFSLQLSQNVKRGLLESAKKHQVIGGRAPLGYRVAPDKTYAIDPKTSPIIKTIFEQYASGSTISEIIIYLNSHGYRTSTGDKFTKDSIPRILHNERYMGVYSYKDIIREENAIPAIIDRDTFMRVQDMLKINRRKPSRKWSYTDYLLSDKLLCGECGASMTGTSGFGKQGVKYQYYACTNHKNGCTKKTVRQDWIEDLVLTEVHNLLQDDDLIEFIADQTWNLYIKESKEQEQEKAMKAQLAGIDKSIANLVKSIEAGLFSDAIVARMDELEKQKSEIKKALVEKELQQSFRLTKDHIVFFLEQFKNMNFEDRECQRRMTDTFVNSMFLFDDHLTIAFNYSGNNAKKTISLKEMHAAPVFECACKTRDLHTASETLRIIWFLHVFTIDIKIPERH